MQHVLGGIAGPAVREKDNQQGEDRDGHRKGGDEQPFLRLVPRAPVPGGLCATRSQPLPSYPIINQSDYAVASNKSQQPSSSASYSCMCFVNNPHPNSDPSPTASRRRFK